MRRSLHRTPRHPGKPRAGVDVVEKNDRVVAAKVHVIGDRRRRGSRADRDRLEQSILRIGIERHQVVEHVGQVQFPARLGVLPATYEKMLVIEWEGMQKLGPIGIDGRVSNDRPDRLAASRECGERCPWLHAIRAKCPGSPASPSAARRGSRREC